MLSFEVIATFTDDIEQDLFEFDLDLKDIDEISFMKVIFRQLLKNVEKLEKLSIIQLNCTEENCCLWLSARDGKYYFNVDINDDPDTRSLNAFRNTYLKMNS